MSWSPRLALPCQVNKNTFLCRVNIQCQFSISQEWLMVLTYIFSSKDLANGFAFGRRSFAFGNAFMCSFPLSTFSCQCPCELPPAPVLEQVRTCPSHLSSHLSSPRTLNSSCKHVAAFQVCKRVDLTYCVYTQMWILQNTISPGLYAFLCS